MVVVVVVVDDDDDDDLYGLWLFGNLTVDTVKPTANMLMMIFVFWEMVQKVYNKFTPVCMHAAIQP